MRSCVMHEIRMNSLKSLALNRGPLQDDFDIGPGQACLFQIGKDRFENGSPASFNRRGIDDSVAFFYHSVKDRSKIRLSGSC